MPDQTKGLRTQYHLRKSERGVLAWDVRKLIAQTAGFEAEEIPLSDIRELDEAFWYHPEGDPPTCRSVAQHAKLIAEADLAHPILIDPDGRVLDGMHRVCKALLLGMEAIPARRLQHLPEPDFTGIPPEKPPYESD